MWECACARSCVSMCVYMHVHVFACGCVHVHAHAFAHVSVQVQVQYTLYKRIADSFVFQALKRAKAHLHVFLVRQEHRLQENTAKG